MATRSLAEELLDKINEEGYKSMVAPLSIDDKLPDHVFQALKKTMKGKYQFSYDLFSNRRGTPKPNGIFELFERYCGDSTDIIRQRLVDYVHTNTADIKSMTTDYFKKKGGDLLMWVYKMSRPSTPGDELSLFLLCKIFNRHAVIHTIRGPWCTLNVTNTGSNAALEDRCDIVLVFIVYGFCEATRSDKSTAKEIPSQTVATVSSAGIHQNVKEKPSVSKRARSTQSISELLLKAHDKDLQDQELRNKQNTKHRKLGLDVDNVLPAGYKKYNTRESTPLRKRQNERTKRDSVKNKNYSDNLDEYHLEAPKRRRKQSIPSRLRSPSKLRVEAQRKIQIEHKTRSLLETTVKEEDNEKKPKVKLEEEEIRKIEKRNKELNKRKKWPEDARLVHMDGTACSVDCMKNSDYHKDIEESDYHRINQQRLQEKLPVTTPESEIINDEAGVSQCNEADSDRIPRNKTGTPSKDIHIDKESTGTKLDAATNLTSVSENNEADTARTSTNKTGNQPENTHTDTENTETKLDTATNLTSTMNSHDTGNSVINELDSVNEDSENTLDAATNLTRDMKRYDIDRSVHDELHQDLPDLPTTTTLDELPGATTEITTNDLWEPANPNDITLPDNSLPTLENNEIFNDFEALMNLENDFDNSNLMPVGGAPVPDVIKEMNTEYSVNQDLEIAMDNARFLDENLLTNSATASSKKTTSTHECTEITKKGDGPTSPKGRFRTKTHGIKKLTPEERKDKKFKCEDCNFTAYSRKGVSDHYTEKHGSCECEYCERFFSNPHALKRHQYDHSSDKRYQCKDCDQEFYFKSELSAHRMKHRENPSFQCMANGCGKNFFRNSDLNAHVAVHSGILHRCDHPGCTYSNYDKRLVTSHKRVHSDKKTFICKYEGCNDSFKHTNARLRHYKRDH